MELEIHQERRLLHPRHSTAKPEYPSWKVGADAKGVSADSTAVSLFSEMVLSETLYPHCAEIEAAAKSRMNTILPQLMKHYGVTERLKAANQLEWVRQMNACVGTGRGSH